MGLAKICCWKFCGCIPLHWAAMLIGIFQIITGIGAIIFSALYLSSLGQLMWFFKAVKIWICEKMFGETGWYCQYLPIDDMMWPIFSLGAISFIFGTLLIFGSRMRVPMLLKSWIFANVLSVLTVAGIVITLMVKNPKDELLIVEGTVYLILAVLIGGYLSRMVYMRSKECWIRDGK